VRAAGWSPLVVLKPRGAKRPLFCVHSGTGSVLPYRHLIGCLGADRPVFGLQLPDLYQEQDGYADIAAIASRHVDTLRRRQPRGPYLLAGHSGGGLVAYEVSRQLHEAGERTALLAVLDNPAPHLCAGAVGLPSVFVVMTNHLSRFVGDRHLVSEDDLRDLPEEEKLRFLLDRLKGHDLAPADAGLDWGRGFVQVQRMISRGVQAYGRQEAARPRTPLPIPIALFRTREATEAWQDPAFEWGGYTSEGVRIFDIGGDHVSMLTQPAVGELAALLDRCLDEADGKPAARPTVPAQ
jgi:thioesterase domain-containing protein